MAPIIVKRVVLVVVGVVVGIAPLLALAGVWSGARAEDANGPGVAVAQAAELDDFAPVVTRTEMFTAFLPVFYAPYDMLDYLLGDEERIFEVLHSSGAQARHQTQTEGEIFYHTKGNQKRAEWEELWADEAFIYRGTDTSPGFGEYYTLRDAGQYGSKWAPRYWAVGDIYYRQPHVMFYRKQDCIPVHGGIHGSYLRFEAFHESYSFASGITLTNVVELAWILRPDGEPVERYYYAEDYGLVAWWSNNGTHSHIVEEHEPGERPDNVREEIPCLDRSPNAPAGYEAPLQAWPGFETR